jgi:hypothetical protein
VAKVGRISAIMGISREQAMIIRIWHGWTTSENADAYETLLRTTIFPAIRARQVAGLEALELLRRTLPGEVEFVTLMRFTSIEAVKAFAGEDYETAVVPPAARAVLARFDARSAHYESRDS